MGDDCMHTIKARLTLPGLVWLFLALSLPVGATLTVFLVVMLGRIAEDSTAELLERNGNRMADYVQGQIESLLADQTATGIEGSVDRINRNRHGDGFRLPGAEFLVGKNPWGVVFATFANPHQPLAVDELEHAPDGICRSSIGLLLFTFSKPLPGGQCGILRATNQVEINRTFRIVPPFGHDHSPFFVY